MDGASLALFSCKKKLPIVGPSPTGEDGANVDGGVFTLLAYEVIGELEFSREGVGLIFSLFLGLGVGARSCNEGEAENTRDDTWDTSSTGFDNEGLGEEHELELRTKLLLCADFS